MTKKRYHKLKRAVLTDLHEYSKLMEGKKSVYSGETLQITSMKREKMMMGPPVWGKVNTYEEAWLMLVPLRDALKENLNNLRGELNE